METNEELDQALESWLQEAVDEFILILTGEGDSKLDQHGLTAAQTLFCTEALSYDARENVRLLFRYAGERGWGDSEMNPDAETVSGIVVSGHVKLRYEVLERDRSGEQSH